MSGSRRPYPPKWADHFLEWFCADHKIDEIQGDLHEAYSHRVEREGKFKSDVWYVLDVIRFFKPSSMSKRSLSNNQGAMFSNHFKISYRNFLKDRVYGSINIMGLVVGLVSCLLISLFVIREFSYDNFHPDAKNKYRVVMDMFNNGDELSAHSAPVYPAVGPGLVEDFPEVDDYLRILPFGDGVYSVKRKDGTLIRYNEQRGVYTDENFFDFFGFELLKGNPETVLSDKHQTVLSESTARKYFGDLDPIGKTILYRGTREYTVTGVMEDFPATSHMQFDIVSSIKSWDGYEEWPQEWGWYDFYTYIQVNPDANRTALHEKTADYLLSKKSQEYEEDGSKEILILQLLPEIHLFSEGLSWEMGDNGGADQIYFLIVIAFLVLIIAWVNFINLSTARAIKRSREVGIRKVIGASKSSLILQFMIEAFLYNLIAFVISFGICFMAVPLVNSSMDLMLEMSYLWRLEIISGILFIIVIGTLISGLYPAYVLTGFKPINTLKGRYSIGKRRFGFRQVLVILQFTISLVLILSTLLVVKQLRFMQSQDIGLNVEQTLVLEAPSATSGREDWISRHEIFKTKLAEVPEIRGYTSSNIVPGKENFSITNYTTRFSDQARDVYRIRVDENYFGDFDIEILAGRNFIKDMASDSNAVLINRRAMTLLGFRSPKDAIGEKLNPDSRWFWRIIGIVEDYHHSSLKEGLDPILFMYRPNFGNYFSLKIAEDQIPETISKIREIWDQVYPDNPFEYFFLDEFFDRQYKTDQQFTAVVNAFAVLAIFVACLGLFGLVSYSAEQARKEIGIRKVLGASIRKIIGLFLKEYSLLMGIALGISIPLGYLVMSRWLEDFAYRTSIHPGIFLVGCLIMLIVATLTVGIKSFTAARSNPVDALRDE